MKHNFPEEGAVIARVGLSQGFEPVRFTTYRLYQAPDVEGYVTAFAYDVSLRFEVEFNASVWLSRATVAEIAALAQNNWCGCSVADSATLCASEHDLDVARFIALVEEVAKSGFYTEINETSAVAWLESYRPAVAQSLKESAR